MSPYKIVKVDGKFYIRCLYYVGGWSPWRWRYMTESGQGGEFVSGDCFVFDSVSLAENFLNNILND